jgi:hypothetical protein
MHTRKGTKNENHRWRDLHEFPIIIEKLHNNHIHSDSKKRRSFLALLFATGDVKRYANYLR